MIKLKNFDDLNDFNLDKEVFKFPSITHCDDEVYIEPLNAIYEVPDNTISVMLSGNKSVFKSFICNGVEMINNDIMPLSDYSEQPLMLYGKSEKVTKRSQYNLKTNVVLTKITQSGYNSAISFDGNKLVDGEQSVYVGVGNPNTMGYFEKYFVCGTEEFNKYFIWNDEFNVYLFKYKDWIYSFGMMPYSEIYIYRVCGVNNPNNLTSEDDMISTLIYNDLGGDGLGTSSVQVEMLDIITKYELDVESCNLPSEAYSSNYDGLGNIVLTFDRPFEEDDVMFMGIYEVTKEGYLIINFGGSSYVDFKDIFTLVEGTESSYYFNNVNTYVTARNPMVFTFTLTKKTDGILLTEDDFVNYTLEYENYFPIEDKVLNCKFKFKDGINDISLCFHDCTNLTYLNFSNINLTNISKMTSLCYGAYELRTVIFGEQQTISLNNIYCLFNECYNLKNVDLHNLFLGNCVNMQSVFSDCNLERINLKGVHFNNANTMLYFFSGCSNLTSVIMDSELNDNLSCLAMFNKVTTNGKLYYNKKYDYSKIIEQLPSTWKAIPVDMG